ncbi:uncharacterized protein LOC135393409 isoform X2 [Ornithodoros turicata]
MIIDPSIGNATKEEYINYTSSLLGGINIKFRSIKNHSIKLGLIGLHVMDETEANTTLPLNSDGTQLELHLAWKAILSFRANQTQTNKSDILYVLTGRKIFSTTQWSKVLSGAVSTKGVCTDDNIAIGNDVFGTYLGMDMFTKNMGRMLGFWSHECYKNISSVLDECHKRHLLSTLRRAWPYCYQYIGMMHVWMSRGQLPGEYFNNTAYCQANPNGTTLKECGVDQKKTQECKLCCAEKTSTSQAHYYDAPHGTLCNESEYESEEMGCLDNNCTGRLWKMKVYANPADDERVRQVFSVDATTTQGAKDA